MNMNVSSAIAALQKKARAEQRVGGGEVLEEALDDLVRSPERIGDHDHLVGSALARARTKVHRRRRLAPVVARIDEQPEAPATDSVLTVTPITTDNESHELIEVRDLIERSSLPARDRGYLRLVSTGFDARDIASLEELPLSQVRVRMSRAHRRARELWKEAA